MRKLEDILIANAAIIGRMIDFNLKTDNVLHLDFTESNAELDDQILTNTVLFSAWVDKKLANANAKYGIGGYNEHRTIYSRSEHFTSTDEPRRLHLGVDIWGKVGTPIYSFDEAKVHSFGQNDHFGDYGATIVLEYCVKEFVFYALYGHLNAASLVGLEVGKVIPKGEKFATFGNESENGSWPPHLHFQLIVAMGDYFGDFPGVCKYSEREQYLANCPNPEVVLRHSFGSISQEFYS